MKENRKHIIIGMPGYLSPESLGGIKSRFTAVASEGYGHVVLDMEKVPHLYSAVVNVIVHLYKELQFFGARLYLVNAGEEVRKAFSFLKLDQSIPVYSSMIEFEMEEMWYSSLEEIPEMDLNPIR